MQSSISSLKNQQKVQEKGRFPSQTLPNPRGVHELNFLNEPAPKMDEVQAIITLRSGVATPMSCPTRMASPNRNPGMLDLFLLFYVLLNFLFQKCRDPNPRPDPNGGSEPEGLLRRFHLSYQNILLIHLVAEAISVLGKPIIIYKFKSI